MEEVSFTDPSLVREAYRKSLTKRGEACVEHGGRQLTLPEFVDLSLREQEEVMENRGYSNVGSFDPENSENMQRCQERAAELRGEGASVVILNSKVSGCARLWKR